MAALFCSQIICQKWGHVCCRGPCRWEEGEREEEGEGEGERVMERGRERGRRERGIWRGGERGRGRGRVREREKRERKGRKERERERAEIIKINIKLPWKPFGDIIILTLLSMCTLHVHVCGSYPITTYTCTCPLHLSQHALVHDIQLSTLKNSQQARLHMFTQKQNQIFIATI